MKDRRPGTVHIIAGGSANPGVLTLRAVDVLSRAEAVVYDATVAPTVIDRTPSHVPRFEDPAGGAEFPDSTEARVERLVGLAQRFSSVVWIVSGDPLLSMRASDVLDALEAADVPFELVPGVPSEMAASAFAGIPLLRRETASGVLVISTESGGVASPLGGLGPSVLTVASIQGGADSDRVTTCLRGIYPEPSVAAALIWSAGTPRQRTDLTSLCEVPAMLRAVEACPAVVLVGEGLSRRRWTWFEKRALFGKRIVITRPRAQAGGFAAALEERGAEVIEFPTIRIQPVLDSEPLREAVRQLEGFDWIVFTSVNGVAEFWRVLKEEGKDSRTLGGVLVGAIGPTTADALEHRGVRADLVPERFVAEAMVEALAAAVHLKGKRILLPRAEFARAVLPYELRARGADVVEVVAYRTTPDVAHAGTFRARLEAGEIDLITFTASSTVQNYVDLIGSDTGRAEVASIGPVTSATARQLGLSVDVEAEEFSIPGLVRALEKHFRAIV